MTAHTCCHHFAGGNCPMSLHRESAQNLTPAFLHTLSHAPFPFVDSALYPFPEINHNQKNNYMLNSVSLSSESSNLGWCWGSPHQNQSIHYLNSHHQTTIHRKRTLYSYIFYLPRFHSNP